MQPLKLRSALLTLAVLFSASGAAAQGTGARLGVNLGAGLSRMTGNALDEIESTKDVVGLHAGLFARLGTGSFSIQPEAAYVMRGVKLEEGGDDETIRVNWIEVALLGRLALGGNGSSGVRPFLYAGPALGFKSSCKAKGSAVGGSESVDCDEVEANVKSTDFGAVLGAGLDFGRVALSARYAMSLSDLNDAADATDADSFKSRTLSVIASIALKLNGQ